MKKEKEKKKVYLKKKWMKTCLLPPVSYAIS